MHTCLARIRQSKAHQALMHSRFNVADENCPLSRLRPIEPVGQNFRSVRANTRVYSQKRSKNRERVAAIYGLRYKAPSAPS